jgi:hypothetical protein
MVEQYEPAGSGAIDVNIASMMDFHRAVQEDLADFADQVRPQLQVLAEEVPFGNRCGFEEMAYLRPRYYDCQVTGQNALDALYRATAVFQYAAKRIAERYAGSDAFAAARPADVAAALNNPFRVVEGNLQ